MNVRSLMQTEVVSLSVDDQLDIADDIMRLGLVRHLPILDGEKLAGIVSHRDLVRAGMSSVLGLDYQSDRDWLQKISVRDVMSTSVRTVHPDQPLRAAVDVMVEHKVGCVPVVEDERLVGLLSETDCLRHLAHLLDTSGA